MRILTPVFIDHFAGRIFNIHPVAAAEVSRAWIRINGRSMPATNGMAARFILRRKNSMVGPVSSRDGCRSCPDDTADSLAARVLEIEHQIYPRAAALFAAGRLEYRKGTAWLDGARLDEPLQFDGSMNNR